MNNSEEPIDESIRRPSRKEIIEMLEEMIKRSETLPAAALYAPSTYADVHQLMLIMLAFFKTD